MGFVAPLLLAGLATLAIPVIIHLIQREKKRVVEFPSLMFLRRIPYQSVRRRRIRHWSLLLLRLAALTLIILAFARPFFRRQELAAATQNGAREVVILLDTSYSMGYGDRWTQARGAARDAINTLGATDRASLVLFNNGADAAVRSTANHSQLTAALDAATLSAGATRFAPALKLAGSLLAESPLPRREILLISDFQRRGWDASPGRDDVRLPERTTVTPVPVTAGSAHNLAVLPPSLQRTRFEHEDRVVVTAGVANHDPSAAAKVPVSLEVNGQVIQTQTVDVAANASSSVSFAPFTVASRNMRGIVRLPDDGLARDNAAYFVVSPLEPVHAAIVNRPGAEREAFYLLRALSIGEEPSIDEATRTPETVADADLQPGAIVILNDVPVSDSLAARLQRFVSGGGGLFVAAGPHTTWPQAVDILPAVPGAMVDRTAGTPLRLGALDYSHPIFELFRAPRSGDFSSPRFYAYRALERAPAHSLARFDDGAPALVDRKVGDGRVLLWTTTLDLGWNDLPVKPVFLPFLMTSVKFLSNFNERPAFATVGQAVPAPHPPAAAGRTRGQMVAIAPSGARVPIAAEDGALELTEQGFYDLRTSGAAADTATAIASNVDPAESDLTRIEPAELMAAVTGRVTGSTAAEAGPRPTPEAEAQAQRIWWYLLVAGGLLLAAETLLSNRLSQA